MKYLVKKAYVSPKLIVHGTVEKITKAKTVGLTDGGGTKSN